MRVENVKGAVWTVDEVEFYKRRPQRCSAPTTSSASSSSSAAVASGHLPSVGYVSLTKFKKKFKFKTKITLLQLKKICLIKVLIMFTTFVSSFSYFFSSMNLIIKKIINFLTVQYNNHFSILTKYFYLFQIIKHFLQSNLSTIFFYSILIIMQRSK